MEFSRTEYPTLLVCFSPDSGSSEPRTDLLRQASLQPEQAINVLNDRVALVSKINNDIADWLQVRSLRVTQ